jgi:hypothetical protein
VQHRASTAAAARRRGCAPPVGGGGRQRRGDHPDTNYDSSTKVVRTGAACDATSFFDQATAAAPDSAAWPDADRLWAAVTAEYRTAIERSPAPGGHDERQLARALWRQASLLSVLGQPGEAADAGREAVAVFTRLHNATAAPDRDEISGELLTAMADLAGFEHAAGRPSAVSEVLSRAAELGLAQAPDPLAAEPHTKAAMGLVYHNYAALLIGGPHDRDDLVQAAMMASLAIDIRQSALDENSAVTFHDLASTCLVFARCLAEMGDHERFAAVVRLAEDLINRLGPLCGDLRAQLGGITARAAIPPLPDIAARRMPAEPPPRRRWWRRS